MSLYLCPAKPRSKFTNESSVASWGPSSKMASRSPGPARSRLQFGPFAYCLFGNEVIWSPMLASKLVWHSHPARLVLMPAHFLASGRRDINQLLRVQGLALVEPNPLQEIGPCYHQLVTRLRSNLGMMTRWKPSKGVDWRRGSV